MTKSSPIFLLIFVFIHPASIFYVNGSSELVLHFEHRTVESLELAPAFVTRSLNYYNTSEERSKLCYYAYMHAKLAYIDYNHVPEWQECRSPGCLSTPSSPKSEEGKFLWAMHCSTLPTIYLLRGVARGNMQIIFFRTSSDLYSFDEEIVHAHSVSLTDDIEETEYLKSHREGMELIFLNVANGRKSLCSRARDHISVAFLGTDVPPAQLYKFGLLNDASNEYIVSMAIACPTSPKIYLSRGSAKKRIKIISVKSGIDRYEFELDDANPISVVKSWRSWMQNMGRNLTRANKSPMSQVHTTEDELSLSQLELEDRMKLCKIARRYHAAVRVPYVEEVYVKEAQFYNFQYSEEKWEHANAIKCSELPQIYLRLDSLEDGRVKIRITLQENPMDHYVHHIQATGLLHKRNYKWSERQLEKRSARHPFVKMSQNDLWSHCFAAQKYLLGDGGANWNFIFAEGEQIVAANKLLLIPKYMMVTLMHGPMFREDLGDLDMFIICSEWPALYIQLGKSPKEIISVLYEEQLVKTEDVPAQIDGTR